MQLSLVTISIWILLLLYNASDGAIIVKEEERDGIARAQQAFWQASEFFDRVNNPIANPSYTFKRGSLRFLATRPIAKLAGFFGAMGGFFGIVLSFISSGDSAELTYMKTEFGQISQKIDRLATSIGEVKNMVKLSTQKAAFIDTEHNIKHGFSRMNECVRRLSSVNCSDETTCRNKKLEIAENYKTSMNVRSDVEKIVRGSISDGVFGTSLLVLVSDSSKCSIPEINKLTNGVVGLLVKGYITLVFYEMLTHREFNFSSIESLIQGDLNRMEKKRQQVADNCIKHIDNWIRIDVQESHGDFVANHETTNRNLLQKLHRKYPWVLWYVCTFVAKNEPHIWSKHKLFGDLRSTAKDLNVHSVVLPVQKGRVAIAEQKKRRFMTVLEGMDSAKDTKSFSKNLLEKFQENPVLKGQIQTLVTIPSTTSLVLSYFEDGEFTPKYIDYVHGTQSNNLLLHRKRNSFVVLASLEIDEADKPDCATTCSRHGECFVFPYSEITGCRCKENYIGLKCNTSTTDLDFLSNINSIVSSTLKLPSLLSVDRSLQNIQMYVQSSAQNIQQALYKLENTIAKEMKNIGTSMKQQFEWFGTLMQYGDTISNLQYFTRIFKEDLSEELRNEDKERDIQLSQNSITIGRTTEREELARFLIKPNAIRKWLYDIHYLLIGRESDSLHSHKSLLFMLMDRNKDQMCNSNYKTQLDKSYRQIMMLQLQGYLIWAQALSSLHLDTSMVEKRYRERVDLQKTTMDETTCSVAIPNSQNFLNCTGGYYLHKDMRPSVTCQDNFFLRGS